MSDVNLKGFYYLGIVILITIIIFTVPLEKSKDLPKVYIYPEIANNLMSTLKGSDYEFVYCLRGTVQDNKILINNFAIPEVISASALHVEAKECNFPDVIGIIHAHLGLFSSCQQSPMDIYTFGITRAKITGIMCRDGDQISFYTPDTLTKSLEWEIGYG